MLVVVVVHQRRDIERGGGLGGNRQRGKRRERGVDEVIGQVQRAVAEVFDLARERSEAYAVEFTAALHAETEGVPRTHRCSYFPLSRATIGANVSIAVDSMTV